MEKDNRLAITENGFFTRNVEIDDPNCIVLEEGTFDLLENFAVESKRTAISGELYEYFYVCEDEKIGKIIKPGNFSGVVSLNDGTQIELFCGIRSRAALLEMLYTIDNMPVTPLSESVVKRGGMNIFEMFVRMFINELFIIMKNGLKQTYVSIMANERFVKGKTIYSVHATKNFAHKERFFVQYDDFSVNRTENKILKSTAKLLTRLSLNTQNRRQLASIISALQDVDYSTNLNADFKKIAADRSMNMYHASLGWSRIFLQKKSSFFFSSKNSGYAVLFPMHRLFESYITKKLSDYMVPPKFSFRLLNKHCSDLDRLSQYSELLPDAIFDTWASGAFTVIDVKWDKKEKRNISLLNDFDEQIGKMYADTTKFNASSAFIIYPKSDSFNDEFGELSFVSQNGCPIKIIFVDLHNLADEIGRIISEFST